MTPRLTWFLAAGLMAMVLSQAGRAEAVKVDARDSAALTETFQDELVQFIQQNYPRHLKSAMRSLQSDQGRLRQDLLDNVLLLKKFARGPVTFEGAYREIRGAMRYVLFGTIHGVQGYPKATIRFETYPGTLRPVTDVELDQDGDGTVDEKSIGVCQLPRLWSWLEARLPQKKNQQLARRPQHNYSSQRTGAGDASSRIGT